MSTAYTVAQHKELHPEQYCPKHRCLWLTGGGYCPRHARATPIAPYKAQAQRIANVYNATAQAEARPDLEEEL